MPFCPTCLRRFPDGSRFCPHDGQRLSCAIGVGSELAGRYRLTEELGRGGMGTVYHAWDGDESRSVAVKVLQSHLAKSDEVRERFRREGQAIALLDHPNIVSLYGAGETAAGTPYLVMELLEGCALDDVFEEGCAVPVARAVELARQVALALGAAHDAGIVHRDLKLANIMLTRGEGGDVIKVVDFGVAKLISGESAARSLDDLTRDGAVFGTPEFMAPEQAIGDRVDARTDLYALGVVLYRLLTGVMPYPGRGMAVAAAHVEAPVPDPSELVPELPLELVRLVMRLLAKRRGDRPRHAREVVASLERVAAALRSPPARDADTPMSVPMFRHAPARERRWLAVGGLSLCLVVGLVALIGALREPVVAWHAPVARHDPAPRREPAARPSGLVDDGARTSLVTTLPAGSARISVPVAIEVRTRRTVVIDVWDADGRPASLSLGAHVLAPDGRETHLSVDATDMPGRYLVAHQFASAGHHVLVVDFAGESSLVVPLDVDDPDLRS